MTTQVRETTRQVWEALQGGGPSPSVRQVYRLVGGSYNAVAAECRVLRAETDVPRPAPSAFLPGIPAALALSDTTPVQAAVAAVVHEIRTNPTYAHNLRVRLAIMENGDGGPLAQLLDVIQRG